MLREVVLHAANTTGDRTIEEALNALSVDALHKITNSLEKMLHTKTVSRASITNLIRKQSTLPIGLRGYVLHI